MGKAAQYSKAIAAALGGLAAAGVLLPAGAPAWMLAAVPVVTAVAAVVAAPRNADKPAPPPPPEPTRYQAPARFPRGPGGGDPPPPTGR